MKRSNRGSLLLGFAPLLVMLTFFCAAALHLSTQTYASTARAERAAAALAGVEGAAKLIAMTNGEKMTEEVGRCLFEYGAPVEAEAQTSIPITVHVQSFDRISATYQYVAKFDTANDRWTFVGWEESK